MKPRGTLLPYAGIVLCFLISVAFEIRFTIDSVRTQAHITESARPPFRIRPIDGVLTAVQPEARAAGLLDGDRPESIEGHPLRGNADVARAVRERRAGDRVEVRVSHGDGPLSASIRLHAQADKPLTVGDWIIALLLDYLTPWFCIVLGFGVAFVRPRDPLAWLLVLLMLSFSKFANGAFAPIAASWGGWMGPAAIFYQTGLQRSWSLWMMLFGQFFPNRSADGLWNRLAQWILGVPLAAAAVTAAFVNATVMNDATALASLQRVLMRFGVALTVLAMIAVNSVFLDMAFKMRSATQDDRRRLKLLYGGALVSLPLLFFVFLWSLIKSQPVTNLPGVLVPALLLLSVFPVTLAYVIVVEKAMELRVAVRQGLRYALASRGARALQMLVMGGLLVIAVRIVTQPDLRRTQQVTLLGIAFLIMFWLRQAGEQLREWIDRRFFREAVNVERVLSDLSDKVRTIVAVEPLLQTVTETISSVLHVPRILVMVRRNGEYAPTHALGYTAPGPQVKIQRSSAVVERLAHSREPLRVSHTRPDAWVDKNVEALGTELLLPLAIKDELLGFVSLGPKRSEEPYSANDLRLLQSVAAQTGLALENSRLTEAVAHEVAQRERLNRELEIARDVQQRLLPQSAPPVPGLDYAGLCRPASSVGGDYYDFLPLNDGHLGIAIGDVSGKGVSAALLMASLQASLRGLAITDPRTLSTLMANLNRLVYEASPVNRFATLFFGVYDPGSRELSYVNAGHNPPMLFRGSEVLRLDQGGLVLGIFRQTQYEQGSIRLEPGDTLVLFTDGVTETMNSRDDEFDEDRLVEAVRGSEDLNALGVINQVMQACDNFAGGAPQHDDMTLVVVRVGPAVLPASGLSSPLLSCEK